MRLTPEHIGNRIFSIPLYQRLFEWDNEKIEQLLNDLYTAMIHRPYKAYYIGMLTATGENALVDGQQRFTVMMLLGIVLRDKDARWEKEFLLQDGIPRLRFLARPEDEKYLEDIITGQIIVREDIIPAYENVKMKRGILCIAQYINRLESDERKAAFAAYVYEHLTFFITTLPEEYRSSALNKYFERMNSTGKNLEGHEILKVRLLQRLDDEKAFYTRVWNRVADMDSPLFRIRKRNNQSETQAELKMRIQQALSAGTNAHLLFKEPNALINGINAVEESLGSGLSIREITKREERPETGRKTSDGTRSVMSFSDFLLQCLYCHLCKKGKECGEITLFFNKADLVSTFEKYLLKEGNGVEIREFFETMLRYRVLLDVYFVRILDDQCEVDYDLEAPYAECEELLILKMLEEMIYVNSSPMTYYQWFSKLMHVVDKTEPVGVQELYLALKQFDDCSHPLSNITDLTYPAIDRYWFWRLDFHIWLNRDKLFECNPGNENLWPRITKAREVAEKYVFKRNRSIEHIAPQTPLQEDTLKLEEDIRNSFGNLVMISSQQNSSLSNSVYLEKKARVDAHLQGSRSGSIESLKMLLAFTFYDEWNEKAISEHGEQAYEILQNSYK